MDAISISPSQAADVIKVCYRARRPLCLWGPPGVGKSQITKRVAHELGIECRDIRAVLFDPVDLRGLPYLKDGKASWAIPDWLPTEGKGILFIDELTRAPTLVQNAFFQLILDRRLGDYILPDGWFIMTASNREGDGGVTPMSSALSNRFVHVNLEPNVDEWCEWANKNAIEPILVAFMRFRPTRLHEFSKTEHAYPTPRSWEFVSDITKLGKQTEETELALFVGAVGHAAAMDYISYLDLWRKLPDIDNIIKNPDTAPVPTDIGTIYAVVSALAARCNVENFDNITRYLEHLEPEHAVFCIKDAAMRDDRITKIGSFQKWILSHSALLG